MVSSLAPAKTILDYAIEYSQRGYSVIPLPYSSKIADTTWREFQSRKPTDSEINTWFENGQVKNLAIVCGQVSGGLVVTEFDVLSNYESFRSLVETRLGLALQDITPVVKTARGYHVYWLVKIPVKSAKFATMEIRSDGNYVLAPPSKHPSGNLYELVNPEVKSPYTIDSLLDIGIDVNQKPAPPDSQPTWVSEALKDGVSEGLRNDTCFRLAGHFKNSQPKDVTEALLRNWNSTKNNPPLPENELRTAIESAYGYPIADISILSYNAPPIHDLDTNRNRTVTKPLQNDVNYSKAFDEVVRGAGGPCDKKEVAVTIGLQNTSATYRMIVSRRRQEGKIRPYRGSAYLIEWVNRDYTEVKLSQAESETRLDIKLPLKIHEYASIPQRCLVGIAGETSTGKTSFLLETAELNVMVQPLPVYYWFNEMSQAKMIYRCEDFPLLAKAQVEGMFHPVMQTDFEFYDVIVPDAINLVDYVDRNDDFYLISQDLRRLYDKLTTGIVIFGLQKNPQQTVGYGGIMSVKLSNLYITLARVSEGESSLQGKVKIYKSKDWTSEKRNPCGLSCQYHTGGMHGKLIIDGDWRR